MHELAYSTPLLHILLLRMHNRPVSELCRVEPTPDQASTYPGKRSRGRRRVGAPTATTTRSSSASAGTLTVTGGRSASTDGVLAAGAAEQQGDLPALGGGVSSFRAQNR